MPAPPPRARERRETLEVDGQVEEGFVDARRHCVAAVWSAVDGKLVAAANVVSGEELRLDWDVRELAGACLARACGARNCVLR